MKKRKKFKNFAAWKKKREVIKKCKNGSPSFNDMCHIAEFLAILRSSYMYGNDERFHLFLGTIPKGHTVLDCHSMIYKEDTFSIAFVLLNDPNTINIEISRTGQTVKSEKERITFEDGQYQFKDVYDQEKMLCIVSCLMNGVVELIEYFYKNKKF